MLVTSNYKHAHTSLPFIYLSQSVFININQLTIQNVSVFYVFNEIFKKLIGKKNLKNKFTGSKLH
jgi:hypothetical protein